MNVEALGPVRPAAGFEPLGITVLRPDGERFDPTMHEAGGVEPTDDDALPGTIAETELVGFADRGRLVREPVVVYRRG
jgi:molecular chaperone GrpE